MSQEEALLRQIFNEEPEGDAVVEPPLKPVAELTPLEQTWIRPEWAGYYNPGDGGFSVNAYFQQTADFIPHFTFGKNRYTTKMVDLLNKDAITIYRKNVLGKDGRIGLNEAYYLYKETISHVSYRDDGQDYKICFYHHPSVEIPHKDFEAFVVKKADNRISVLLQNKYEGIYSSPADMEVPKEMDLALNYGDAFVSRHTDLVNKLNSNRAGLFILFGVPGSGKSTMIKHLTSLVDREFIYVPVGMVSQLASPDMMSFLMEKKNSILVLEDAEKAVRTREDNADSSVVSTLLNLTDGILGNVLNISIIATYNAERETVDKAFLRKGRLKFEHEFKSLTLAETNRLLTHLKLPASNKPLTLAEIYYLGDDTGHVEPTQRSMGFGAPTPK